MPLRRLSFVQLASQGMAVKTAASAIDALGLLTGQENFDVAILDMQMPEMNGVELTANTLADDRSALAAPAWMVVSASRS